jgi:hypothetical protein
MTLATLIRDLARESGFIRIESHANAGAIKVQIDWGMAKPTLYIEADQLTDETAEESLTKVLYVLLDHIRNNQPHWKQSTPAARPSQPGPDLPTFFS